MKKLFLLAILMFASKTNLLNCRIFHVYLSEIDKQFDDELKRSIEQLDLEKVKRLYSRLQKSFFISGQYQERLNTLVEKMKSDFYGTKLKNFSRFGIGATFTFFSTKLLKNLFTILSNAKDIAYDYKISKNLISDYFHGQLAVNRFNVPLAGFSIIALIAGVYQIKNGFDIIQRAKSDKAKVVNEIYNLIYNDRIIETNKLLTYLNKKSLC